MKVKVKFEVNSIYRDVYLNRMIYIYKEYEAENIDSLYDILNKDIHEKDIDKLQYFEVLNLHSLDNPKNIEIKFISIKDDKGQELLSNS